MSCDNEATRGFGPLMPGHLKVDFGDAEAIEKIFKGSELFHTLSSIVIISIFCLA
jgi:acetylornithine/succinyldiaminopimelate/putrescine aminotransferase